MTPPRTRLANLPTPVQSLGRLSARWGGPRLVIKRDDYTGAGLCGNKIRKLEFCFGEARAQGATKVLTCGGVQSNHCRATALAAARLGMECVVYLRCEVEPTEIDGNHLLDRLAGAEVRFVTAAEYNALGPTAEGYWIPEGASNEVGMWGYREACAEFETFDALVHAVGSGGTTAGLIAGAGAGRMETPLIGVSVCDDAAYFHEKIDGILDAARERWPREMKGVPCSRDGVEILDGFCGRGYARSRPEEWALLHEVAQTEGVILDPVYTVKAMMGLRQMIRDGRFTEGQTVCFLHTGGIYGLFPKRDEALAV